VHRAACPRRAIKPSCSTPAGHAGTPPSGALAAPTGPTKAQPPVVSGPIRKNRCEGRKALSLPSPFPCPFPLSSQVASAPPLSPLTLSARLPRSHTLGGHHRQDSTNTPDYTYNRAVSVFQTCDKSCFFRPLRTSSEKMPINAAMALHKLYMLLLLREGKVDGFARLERFCLRLCARWPAALALPQWPEGPVAPRPCNGGTPFPPQQVVGADHRARIFFFLFQLNPLFSPPFSILLFKAHTGLRATNGVS